MEKQGNESSRDIEPEEVDTLASDNVPEPSAHETVSIPPRKTRRVRVGRIAGGGSSAVWTYFTKNSDKTSVCNLCGASHKHQNPGNLSKHLQWAHAKQYRKEIIRLVRREMECENQDVVMVQNQTSSSLKTGSMHGGFFKRKQLSVSDTHAASSGSVSLNRSIESKIEQYLEEISPLANAAPSEIPSPIQFWEMKLNTSLKELAELALDVMAIPAASAGMERGFSHCGIATAGRRHRLTAQNLENEIILRLNNDFIYY